MKISPFLNVWRIREYFSSCVCVSQIFVCLQRFWQPPDTCVIAFQHKLF